MCACLRNSSCDPVSGACTCGPGWRGDRCEKPCPQGHYGLDCKEVCKCKNGGGCDTESGSCTCQSGWMGALCDTPCPVGRHGTNCTSSCQCQNEGRCHPETGHCLCKPGWEVSTPKTHFKKFPKHLFQGLVCANPCPSGSYGEGCKKKCECYNGAGCDPLNGNCRCKPGYRGSKVSRKAILCRSRISFVHPISLFLVP